MGGCHSVVQTAPWRDHQDPRVLQALGMATLPSRSLKDDEKKSAGDQAHIARVRAFACIPSQDSDRFGPLGLAFHIMPCVAIHSKRNGDIRYPRGSIMRERITKTVSITRCTCERCGHTWDVPDGQKIQRSCPSRACRSPLWDKPITRQGASDFAKAARPKDWAARRARGWKHPSSKS